MKLNLTYLIVITLLFISCSSDENLNPIPLVKKLTSTRYLSNGDIWSESKYLYAYSDNEELNEIRITRSYPERQDRNQDYTIHKYFSNNQNTHDIYEHHITRNQNIERFTYIHENNLIVATKLVYDDGSFRSEELKYDNNKNLIEKINLSLSNKQTYSYDSNNNLIQSTYTNLNTNDSYITKFKYLDVINPTSVTSYLPTKKAYNLSKFIRINFDETAEIEKNEYNLPLKIIYKNANGSINKISVYEYE